MCSPYMKIVVLCHEAGLVHSIARLNVSRRRTHAPGKTSSTAVRIVATDNLTLHRAKNIAAKVQAKAVHQIPWKETKPVRWSFTMPTVRTVNTKTTTAAVPVSANASPISIRIQDLLGAPARRSPWISLLIRACMMSVVITAPTILGARTGPRTTTKTCHADIELPGSAPLINRSPEPTLMMRPPNNTHGMM